MINKQELIDEEVTMLLLSDDLELMNSVVVQIRLIAFVEMVGLEGQVSVQKMKRADIINEFELTTVDEDDKFVLAIAVENGEYMKKEAIIAGTTAF